PRDLLRPAVPDRPGAPTWERAGPGRRAGRGILADSVGRNEDARLPGLAVPGEARGAVGVELEQRGDVGLERRYRLRGAELDQDVARPLAVQLHRQPRL